MHAQFPADIIVREASTPDGRAPHDAGNFAAFRDLGALADRFIIRLDGIILNNGIARDGAAAWLRSIAGRYALVSSNSRDTARTMTAKLRRTGLDVPEQRIVLAGEEALRFAAAQYPGARCKVLASRVLAHAARGHGLELVQDNAEVILLGRDSAWTYRDLALVVHELSSGARLIVSNGDLTRIGHSGRPLPDTGAILASIEAAAGDKAAIIRFPGAAPLRIALDRLNEAGGNGGGETLVITNQEADLDAIPAIAGLRCMYFEPGAVDDMPGTGAVWDERTGSAQDDIIPATPTMAPNMAAPL